MTSEENLLQKTFYEERFLSGQPITDPVQTLGGLFFEEQKKELADLSYIRFAQGEVYFHAQDYEAAIYKWEHVHNELEPWAKKNIADAYLELELLEMAETLYRSITSDSATLNPEIALQLFTLYIEQHRHADADEIIKNAVILYPDYPNVTKIARAFFEEQQDWQSAVKLAADEAERTHLSFWFHVLTTYAEQKHVIQFAPAYYTPVLSIIMEKDMHQFERTATAFWQAYKHEESFLAWLEVINERVVLLDGSMIEWKSLSDLYKTAYLDLAGGAYSLHAAKQAVPGLLQAWLKIAAQSDRFFAAAAALAWEDQFPGSMEKVDLAQVKQMLSEAVNHHDLLEDALYLFENLKKWAEEQQLKVSPAHEWMVRQSAAQSPPVIALAGLPGNEIEVLLQSLGEIQHGTRPAILFKRSEEEYTTWIDDEIEEVGLVSGVLANRNISILQINEITGEEGRARADYFSLAQNLIFVLGSLSPFTHYERQLLTDIRKRHPRLPIHFVLNFQERVEEEEASHLLEETRNRIHVYFPDSKLLSYDHRKETDTRIWDHIATSFSNEVKQQRSIKTSLILNMIAKTIAYSLNQEIQMKSDIESAIVKQEDLLSRLKGSIHQLKDIEEEKGTVIQSAFRSIKEEIKPNLLKTIPKIIRETSELITEESDFKTIHLELNNEMNRRIDHYLHTTVLPIYTSSMQDWIEFSKRELDQSQELLDEWSVGFNELYGEDRMALECDFQIFEDWKRDGERMTSSVMIEKENILLKRTPGQVLLKGAGKLFGSLPKNKSVLVNTYKNFVQNELYEETAESVARRFFAQFELFEKSIGRDIAFFFRNPSQELQRAVEKLEENVENNTAALEKIRSNPEAIRSPLSLFEARLRQYEWMNMADASQQKRNQQTESR